MCGCEFLRVRKGLWARLSPKLGSNLSKTTTTTTKNETVILNRNIEALFQLSQT